MTVREYTARALERQGIADKRGVARSQIDRELTATIRHRYDRGSRMYDLMEAGIERLRFGKWRRLQWSKVAGPRILEVGVGTGKNLPYYPRDKQITAIDFSKGMLARARRKAARLGTEARLIEMDVQSLDFAGDTFDTVVSTFVFCSVPDPIQGLKEVARVVRPGGKVVLLEHVLSANTMLAWLMNAVTPITVRVSGANMNRRTVENVAASGLVVERVTDIGLGIVKLIEARKEE